MLNPRLQRPKFQTSTLIAGVVLLLIIFASAGYFFMLPAGGPAVAEDPAYAEFDRNRALWERRRPAEHTYVVDRDCVCPREFDEPYRVTVTASATSFSFDGAGADAPPSALDIDALFDLVEDAIAGAHRVQVFYDADFGFPMILTIDWDEAEGDDEQGVDVREFRPLM